MTSKAQVPSLARIPLAKPRGFLAAIMGWLAARGLGRVPKSWGIAAHERGLQNAMLRMEIAIHRHPKISPRLACLVSLKAARYVGCPY